MQIRGLWSWFEDLFEAFQGNSRSPSLVLSMLSESTNTHNLANPGLTPPAWKCRVVALPGMCVLLVVDQRNNKSLPSSSLSRLAVACLTCAWPLRSLCSSTLVSLGACHPTKNGASAQICYSIVKIEEGHTLLLRFFGLLPGVQAESQRTGLSSVPTSLLSEPCLGMYKR